jgi:stage IV sporulation protein B
VKLDFLIVFNIIFSMLKIGFKLYFIISLKIYSVLGLFLFMQKINYEIFGKKHYLSVYKIFTSVNLKTYKKIIMDVIKMPRNIKNKIIFYTCIFLLTAWCISSILMPKKINICENSAYDAGFGLEQEKSVTVLSNDSKKVKDNIKIELTKNSNLEADSTGKYDAVYTFAGIPVKKAEVNVLPKSVLVSGNVTGVVIKTDGVLVLGTGKVTDKNGNDEYPSEGKLKSGDIIEKIDGIKTDTKEQMQKAIEKSNGADVAFIYKRDGDIQTTDISPVFSRADGKYRIGCWVRDDTQGLGTMTFVENDSKSFGILGHGIFDVDTGKLMEASNGNITGSSISGIVKGKKGSPGEVSGMLDKKNIIGKISSNTEYGVYGKITQNTQDLDLTEAKTAMTNDIKLGNAVIKSDILGKMEEYNIEITGINQIGSPDKGLLIKVTDSRLLDGTGGIIQGMSGSPILQDGKFIGAVTHVFVNDPTKGYGIFAETMLEQAQKSE